MDGKVIELKQRRTHVRSFAGAAIDVAAAGGWALMPYSFAEGSGLSFGSVETNSTPDARPTGGLPSTG